MSSPRDENTILRTARKAHHCRGAGRDGHRVPCLRGDRAIAAGERYIEYVGEASPYGSGDRYHLECAASQGLLLEGK